MRRGPLSAEADDRDAVAKISTTSLRVGDVHADTVDADESGLDRRVVVRGIGSSVMSSVLLGVSRAGAGACVLVALRVWSAAPVLTPVLASVHAV